MKADHPAEDIAADDLFNVTDLNVDSALIVPVQVIGQPDHFIADLEGSDVAIDRLTDRCCTLGELI
jgi:hypothetical protein